jgi:hypothetical protein
LRQRVQDAHRAAVSRVPDEVEHGQPLESHRDSTRDFYRHENEVTFWPVRGVGQALLKQNSHEGKRPIFIRVFAGNEWFFCKNECNYIDLVESCLDKLAQVIECATHKGVCNKKAIYFGKMLFVFNAWSNVKLL